MTEPQVHHQTETGEWVPAIPLPYPHGLIPWLWKRLTGWRDEYGRKAHLWTWGNWQ